MTAASEPRPAAIEPGSARAVSLELVDATARYPGAEQPAVDQLNLAVPAGEICVLVGPSGCGKTTAMRMVNRMIELSSGDIRIGGDSVCKRRPAELRREIGYVIQQVGLFPHRTVGENIGLVPELVGWDKKRIRARVEELLELIGLTGDYRDRYPAQLSGGQSQRVGVARALAADPPLMLMDEPFGAIDPINRDRLQNEFLRLQSALGKTIVFVTHDIDEAIKLGDRIAVLRERGQLAQYATPGELLRRPAGSFVEDLVGADRALKRLTLQRVRDVGLWSVALVRTGEQVSEARAKLADADLEIPLLVDEQRRPLGWLSESGLQGERVREVLCSPALPLVELDDVLRKALSDLLATTVQYAPVVDDRGGVVGVLSIEALSDAMTVEPEAAGAPAAVGPT